MDRSEEAGWGVGPRGTACKGSDGAEPRSRGGSSGCIGTGDATRVWVAACCDGSGEGRLSLASARWREEWRNLSAAKREVRGGRC